MPNEKDIQPVLNLDNFIIGSATEAIIYLNNSVVLLRELMRAKLVISCILYMSLILFLLAFKLTRASKVVAI